jgi:hypothetical protein
MTNRTQRNRRRKQRRHHSHHARATAQWRRRVGRWSTDDRLPEQATNLAHVELALDRAAALDGILLRRLAERTAHRLLWAATYDDALRHLTDPARAVSWQRLVRALDPAVHDEVDDYGDGPLRMAQRRMVVMAALCEFKQGRVEQAA